MEFKEIENKTEIEKKFKEFRDKYLRCPRCGHTDTRILISGTKKCRTCGLSVKLSQEELNFFRKGESETEVKK